MDKGPVLFVKFYDKSINTVSQIYDFNSFFINGDILKERYKLQQETYFQWVQLIGAILRSLKYFIKQNKKTLITILHKIII